VDEEDVLVKCFGDTEAVNLSTGERWQRASGDGESLLFASRGPIDVAKLGPCRDVVFGPAECEPTTDEIVRHAKKILEQGKTIMHYRNGREAKNGDKLVKLSIYEPCRIEAVGILFDATPGNDYCNGSIAPLLGGPVVGACMCDCLHMDDVVAMLKEKGLDKRPEGK